MIAELESKLLEKIDSVARVVGTLAEKIAGLSEKVNSIHDDMHEARQHGERIRALETDVGNIKGDLKSAATERRWIVGLLASAVGVLIVAAIAFAALMVQVWGKHGGA